MKKSAHLRELKEWTVIKIWSVTTWLWHKPIPSRHSCFHPRHEPRICG